MLKSFGAHAPQRTGATLAAGSALWAGCFVVTWKLAEGTATRGALVLALLLTASVVSTIITLVMNRGRLHHSKRGWVTAVVLGFFTIIGNLASITALKTCNPAVVSIVFQLQIFIIAGLERIVMRHRIAPMMLLGAVVAVGGVILMQLGVNGDERSADVPGLLWALLAAASFGTMLVVTRHAAQHIDILSVNMLRLWLAVIVVAAWPGVLADVITLPVVSWLYAGLSALCGLVISRLLLMYAVRYIPATTTKLISLMSPLFALGLSWVVLDSVPGWRDLAGGAIILLGVALPLWWAWRREGRGSAL